ncbi:leucine-rich repeat domain-containing protein [bacterium]|nr:leucine-rich repeat domain-containing protein [bacterium]
MNEEAMRQALRQCIELKGAAILADKSKFRGAVHDLLPGLSLQKERNMLIIAVESFSLGKRLLEAPQEDAARKNILQYLLKDLTESGISTDAASAVLQSFAAALEWNIAGGSAGTAQPQSDSSALCAHRNIDFYAFRCQNCGQTLCGLYGENTYTPYEKLGKRERGGVLLSVSGSCAGTLVLPDHITALGDDCLAEQQELQEVVLPASLLSIGRYAFDACPALKTLNVPSTVTSIGEGAFQGLRRVYYGGPASGSPWGAKELIASLDPAAKSPQSLQLALNAPSAPAFKPIQQPVRPNGSPNAFIADKADNDFSYYRRADLNKVVIPEGITAVGDFAFTDCGGLTEVVIPDTAAKIGECAFFKCGSLTGLVLPKSVAYIGRNAFNGCSGLTDINVPAGVTFIGQNAFAGVKRVCYDGPAAGSPWGAGEHIKSGSPFSPASGPASRGRQPVQPSPYTPPAPAAGPQQPVQPQAPPKVLTADKADHSFAYERRDDFSEAIIPEGITSIGDFAFLNCRSLTSVVVPSGVVSIGDNAFAGCSKLKEIVLPYGVDYIGRDAFNGCIRLTRAVLPDTVKTIGRDAFRNCIDLSFVSDPAGLADIGDNAFENCPKLTKLPETKTWFQRLFDQYSG